MKDFALKLTDVMAGVVLGVGFTSWPYLKELWQFIAFIFVYLSIIDYWIDTIPALKKYPPRHQVDLMIDVAIMFSFFLFIYSTQQTVVYFLAAFIVFRVLDALWVTRVKGEYQPTHYDELVVNTWLLSDITESVAALILIISTYFYPIIPLALLLIFIGFRLITRIWASMRYKRVYFV